MDGEDRRPPGKIRAVLRLIEAHPAEAAFDFRTRFGLPVAAVFDDRLDWDEAWMLIRRLIADPTSHLGAAHAGWDHPVSREALVLFDLYDLTVAANSNPKKGKAKPYPRPFKQGRRRSSRPTVGQATIAAALAARGHRVPERSSDG